LPCTTLIPTNDNLVNLWTYYFYNTTLTDLMQYLCTSCSQHDGILFRKFSQNQFRNNKTQLGNYLVNLCQNY